MQSPWGDGNNYNLFCFRFFVILFEKCSPREGTETQLETARCTLPTVIWEMQSPWGDGNVKSVHSWKLEQHNLRNAVPVRGRKPKRKSRKRRRMQFEKCSPREGTETIVDENLISSSVKKFEKCSPREGTETYSFSYFLNLFFLFEKCSPREGTETVSTFHRQSALYRIWEMQSPWGDGNLR